jgi:transposase
MAEQGIQIHSVDEKMGIQAREHKNPSIAMVEGQVEKIDPEYIRHGTSGIIASRNVASGEIEAPLVQPTRTEEDFAKHVQGVVELAPSSEHIFISDNLNTHKSETLVRFIAEVEGIPQSALGLKDKKGVLKSLASREAFLSDTSHKIRFVYTPKHCSWLNQIECWFGIITRRLLNRRSSFLSVSDLENKICAFIDYYNQYLKKPFQWNYKGKILTI